MAKSAGSLRSQAIVQALAEANKLLTFDQLLNAACGFFPFNVKMFKATLSSLASSYSPNSRLIQRTLDDKYVWLPNLVAGAIFRHILSGEELKKHHLLFEPEIVTALWPSEAGWRLNDTSVTWVCTMPDGSRMTMRPEMLAQKGWSVVWGIRGEPALWAWLKNQNAQAGDALIFTIADSQANQCRVTFESRGERDEARIAARNLALADAAHASCKSRRSGVALTDLAARLIALNLYHDVCPPDPLESVLNNDSRFMWEQERIKLATRYNHVYATLGLKEPDIFEILEDVPRRPKRKRSSRKEFADKVFRFYATFRHSKSPWRRIEIRGDQSLAELDVEMRDAFGHDFSDHLSEFYLGTDADSNRRGLGTHEPGGGGGGSQWMVGELELEPGDVLSYTYDFGDNIQHVLKLEAIVPPEPKVKYPRVAEQNKPRYHYCEDCKEDDKKEIATWICLDCSNEKQRRVLICEEHAASEHEDHYTEELVY